MYHYSNALKNAPDIAHKLQRVHSLMYFIFYFEIILVTQYNNYTGVLSRFEGVF